MNCRCILFTPKVITDIFPWQFAVKQNGILIFHKFSIYVQKVVGSIILMKFQPFGRCIPIWYISINVYEIIEARLSTGHKTKIKCSHIGRKKVINEEKI